MIKTINFNSRRTQIVKNTAMVSIPQGVAMVWGLYQGRPLYLKLLENGNLLISPKNLER